jgi:hypothetical protein
MWAAEGIGPEGDMDKATHYRSRAADVRKIAKGIYDPVERHKMIAIADDYESFSHEAEISHQRLARGLP